MTSIEKKLSTLSLNSLLKQKKRKVKKSYSTLSVINVVKEKNDNENELSQIISKHIPKPSLKVKKSLTSKNLNIIKNEDNEISPDRKYNKKISFRLPIHNDNDDILNKERLNLYRKSDDYNRKYEKNEVSLKCKCFCILY